MNESSELARLREENKELAFHLGRYEQQLRRMQLINEIAEAANKTSNPYEAVQYTLARICRSTDWPAGHAFFVSRRDGEPLLVSSGIWHLADRLALSQFVDYTEKLHLRPGEGLPGIVYRDREALWTNALRSDAQRFAAARRVGLQSSFCFPVISGEEITAVLEFFSGQNDAPDEIVLDIVSQLGVLLGQVFERRRAADEREALSDQLIDASRQAGMAEVASGVLHNVGNVLNSITVSSTLLYEQLDQSGIGGVGRLAELLSEHRDDLVEFLNHDEKGQKIVGYIHELADHLKEENDGMKSEMESLLSNIEHIKNVVRKQQHYGRPTNVNESVDVKDLLEDALRINELADNPAVAVERHYGKMAHVFVDKHNLIQILNNLLRNARQAFEERDEARVEIFTGVDGSPRYLFIRICDNGCGIPLEVQDKIFRFGFTTKSDGHGFGLHTSANTAQSMGGNLTFFSEGRGKGTTFTLTLPYTPDTSAEGGLAA